MVQIGQAQNTVDVDRTGMGYLNANTNSDAFGVGIAQAKQRLGEASKSFLMNMGELYQGVQRTKALQLSNYIDQLERDMLSDPQKGYYSKLGSDAMSNPDDPKSGANGVLSDIDRMIAEKQEELGLTWGVGLRAAEYVKTKKMDVIYRGATAHELKQTQTWGLQTVEEAQTSAIQKGVMHRDNPDDMATALKNGEIAIIQKAKLLHWDKDTTRITLAKYISDYHSGIISAYTKDGSLQGKEYYEKHKNEILPDDQEKVYQAVRNVELNYWAESSANNLFEGYGDDQAGAYAEVDKIENLNERDAVERKLDALYNRKQSLENNANNNMLDDFYETVNRKLETGQIPSYADIPQGLPAKLKLDCRSYIDSKSTPSGKIDTNNEKFMELYNMRFQDPQGFADLNLAPYKPYLSANDLKSFQKEQADIKNMTPTELADNDSIIKEGAEALNFKIDKKTGAIEPSPWFGPHSTENLEAYKNMLHSYIHNLEEQKGRSLNRTELGDAQRKFTQDYKIDPKKYQYGMNHQVNFLRNLNNDFAKAQQEKKAPLTRDEKYKILAERVSMTQQEINQEIVQDMQQAKKEAKPVVDLEIGDYWRDHRITSTYGKRKQPTKGASTFHKGVDLSYKMNEKIGSFTSGKVINVVNNHKGYGNYVDIQSPDGVTHRYAHCASISVKKGQQVQEGEQIARAGSTGISTGPHLHYEVIADGKSINPLAKRDVNKKQKSNTKIAEGTIIKNNKTGVRMMMKGGKWITI